jgi:hypothetical protein
MTGPLALFGANTAAAQDNKEKDKEKEKDKGNQGNQGGPGASGCRGEGHPCEGNQVCCEGLVCPEAKGETPPGNARRCTKAQTVVTTQTAVCTDDCPQTNQQTVLVENKERFGTPPSYWIDVVCNFDAPLYRTVCDCIAYGQPTAPPVRKITLPPADICAVVITEELRPAAAAGAAPDQATGGEANAGTGGVANADASGGSVTVGDVRGDETDIAIDASGGTASADASGGDSNVAIAGGGQVGDAAGQAVELSTLRLELEGNVVPGKLTTYWVDTEAGRRPASGPALVQVAEAAENTGAIIAEARVCPIAQPQEGYDWFGQCTTPATDMRFTLASPGGGDGTLPTAGATNAQGRARFGELTPGAYLLQPEGTL